jgi:hypothetical protein
MSGQLFWIPGQFLVKQYTGPCLNLADRIVDKDVYRGPIALCRANALLRGTFGSNIGLGSLSNQGRSGWVCTSSDVEWEQKGIGKLTINWEVGGPFAPIYLQPLDDWREETVELYPKVERNQNLSYADEPLNKIAPETIALVYQAARGASTMQQSTALDELNAMPDRTTDPPANSTWDDQWNFSITLYNWLMLGHETYYLAGVKYCYIRHYFNYPMVSMGGIIQAPQFGPRAGDTTFSWLRLADAVEPVGVNGSAFKLTSTWLGGPSGHWDATLYKNP